MPTTIIKDDSPSLLTSYQPLPPLTVLEHLSFNFPDNTRKGIEKKSDDHKETVLINGLSSTDTANEVATEHTQYTTEEKEMIEKFKAEHSHGIVSVIWITANYQQRLKAYVCEVWVAPNDKRNFRCVPPCKPYTKMRAYISGCHKAIVAATQPSTFDKGDALVVCIDDAEVIKAIVNDKRENNHIRNLAKRLWEENGSEIVFVLNGIRVDTRGAMFEESVLQQASVMAQKAAQNNINAQMRKRERAVCLSDLRSEPQPHHFMNDKDLASHYIQNTSNTLAPQPT